MGSTGVSHHSRFGFWLGGQRGSVDVYKWLIHMSHMSIGKRTWALKNGPLVVSWVYVGDEIPFAMCRDYKIHPGRLTWNLKITQLKRKIIFQTSFLVSMLIFGGVNHEIRIPLTLGFQTPKVRRYLKKKNPTQKTKHEQVFGRLGLNNRISWRVRPGFLSWLLG